MGKRFRCRIGIKQTRDKQRRRRFTHERLKFALLARRVLRSAPFVFDRIEDAGLLRFEYLLGRFELRDLGVHFLKPLAFPVAQSRAEDRVTSGLAFSGVGHREQIKGNRTHELVIAAHVRQTLRRERECRKRGASDKRDWRLHESLRLPYGVTQDARQRLVRIRLSVEQLGQGFGLQPFHAFRLGDSHACASLRTLPAGVPRDLHPLGDPIPHFRL
jgi:hypothetical protein